MDLFAAVILFILGVISAELVRFMIELRKEGKQLQLRQGYQAKDPEHVDKPCTPPTNGSNVRKPEPDPEPEPFVYWYICTCGYATDEKPWEHMNRWNEMMATGKTGHFDPCPQCGQTEGMYERVSARKLPDGKLERAKV